MPINSLRYDQMIEEALRGVVRRALRTVLESGLPGSHHFYITFRTTAPGVEIADRLHEKYPEEMTIVLQYQFWALEVSAERFAVTLSFNDVPERLVVPFAAVTAFVDPAAKWGMEFQHKTGAAPEEVETGAPAPVDAAAGVGGAQPTGAVAADPPGDTKVITLDNFRRK